MLYFTIYKSQVCQYICTYRPVWLPTLNLDNEDESSGVLATKFGGINPWLNPEEGWPECHKCGRHKTFLCQFVVSELPQEMRSINESFTSCRLKIHLDNVTHLISDA